MKNVVFLRKGVAPFENYNAGATGAFDDAVANMLISERYAKEAPAPSTGTKLIRSRSKRPYPASRLLRPR